MKKFNEMDCTEKEKIVELFATWLKPYTHEVIIKVLERRDEIIEDEMSMYMLKELHTRSKTEAKEFISNINSMFRDFEVFKEFDPHNHALTHAGSYRDILYDMYIRN